VANLSYRPGRRKFSRANLEIYAVDNYGNITLSLSRFRQIVCILKKTRSTPKSLFCPAIDSGNTGVRSFGASKKGNYMSFLAGIGDLLKQHAA
jgi:hypothetical protein